MAGKYQAYPEYKVSSDDWLGKIPSSWVGARFKYGINLIESGKRESVEYSDILSIGGEHVGFNGKLKLDNLKYVSKEYYERSIKGRVNKGDILIVKDGATIGKTAYVNEEPQQKMLLNEHVYRVVSHKFNYYYILSSYFQAKIWSGNNSSAQEGLNLSTILNIPFIIPSQNTQEKIASFLDHETAKIDTLIEKQQQLINLLKEKRQAVISHAVTKGLNPDAPMRDSGVEWLGEVPEHWDVSQLKYKVKPGTSITYGIVQAGPHIEDGVPYIKTSDMSGNALPLDGYSKTSKLIDDSYNRSKVYEGDLVIGIRASVGKCLPVPKEISGANLTQGTAKISPCEELDRDFLLSYLSSSPVQTHLNRIAKGATFKEITLDMLRRVVVLIPPEKEQALITKKVSELAGHYRRLIEASEKQMVLLSERRTALISAAVTGKIDVRNWQDPVPSNTSNNKEVAA